MIYIGHLHSLIGDITIESKNNQIIGLWFSEKKEQRKTPKEETIENEEEPTILKAKHWLNEYFEGKNPSIKALHLNLIGTSFQKEVWDILLSIPYGTTTTYQEITKLLLKKMKKSSMSYQAVGNAIAKNPILIIIPCHRVIGKSGNLTGYAGGLDKKEYLLKLEQTKK